MFEFHIYNHSNDALTAAIRAHIDVIRQLATVCVGEDAGGTGRTLADYIRQADAATTRPRSFYRRVDILWRRTNPALSPLYCQDRRFRVTYSGNVRAGGGVAFEGYCIVDRRWWAQLLPLHPTRINVEYHAGIGRDLIVVVT